MRYCVISLIFNNYEIVREIVEKSENCDYFLFTDNPNLISETWQVIYLKEFDTNELKGIQKTIMFKYSCYKYIPNIEQYEYFIRIDHSIQIFKPLDCIIDYMKKYKYDIMCTIHPVRDTFNDEYNAWIEYRNLDNRFKDIFFNYCKKDNIGLIETTVMVYKNCKEIFNLLDCIYITHKENDNFEDLNDQCYFTYELYKMKDKLRILFTNMHLYMYTDLFSKMLLVHKHNEWVYLYSNINTIKSKIFEHEQIVKLFSYG